MLNFFQLLLITFFQLEVNRLKMIEAFIYMKFLTMHPVNQAKTIMFDFSVYTK